MTVQLYIKLHNITIFVLHMVDLPKHSHDRFFQSLQSLPKKKKDLTITKHLCSFSTILLYLKVLLILKEFYTTNTDKLS